MPALHVIMMRNLQTHCVEPATVSANHLIRTSAQHEYQCHCIDWCILVSWCCAQTFHSEPQLRLADAAAHLMVTPAVTVTAVPGACQFANALLRTSPDSSQVMTMLACDRGVRITTVANAGQRAVGMPKLQAKATVQDSDRKV